MGATPNPAALDIDLAAIMQASGNAAAYAETIIAARSGIARAARKAGRDN